MVKIRGKGLSTSQRNIILSIILLIIIASLIVGVVLSNNNSKEVFSENIENMEEEMVINEEEKMDYIDISQLEQKIEEENDKTQNKDEEKNDKESNSTDKKNVGGAPYYIKINYGAQVVTIYKKDEEGNYTVPVKAMVCSTGVATPKSGVYKIQYRWKWLGLQGDVYGQYATQIVGNILFHSVPYLERGNPGSLEYWEYDKLGTYASAGCIRLKVSDAIWIYNNCERGTKVEFYSSSNPGPLGKPSAKKISNAEGNLKNWDPTDPDPNNPWKNYKSEENKNSNTNTNVNVNTNNNTNTETNTNSNTNTDKNTNTNTNIQIDNTQIDNDKTNTEVIENTINNEIINDINTNIVQSNEIDTNNEDTDISKDNEEI